MVTRSNTLKVAARLSLDADYMAGASCALIGKRGSGKTYACRVLAEELVGAGVQTVIIDPMGVFWGLRAGAGGQREGLPIPVFGGEHGDAPLESSAGTLMADLVVEEGLSMVLDLSGFGSRTQERTFAAAFFDRLYRTNRDLVHLIVDEADLFGPQRPRREDTHLLVTLENIVRRGRNKGIGITMATQRAAVLNKDILTQVDALAALRVTAPQDRDAIREWVRGQGDEDTWSRIAPSLPGLVNGQCWWWIPERGILTQVQVRATRTFDSSPTRRRGHAGRAPKTFADVDLATISDRIAATIERARATDPRELTRRIRELERELAARPPAHPPAPRVVTVPVLDDTLVARAEQAIQALGQDQAAAAATTADLLRRVEQTARQSKEHTRQVTQTLAALTAALTTARTTTSTTPAPGPTSHTRSTPEPVPPPASDPPDPNTTAAPNGGAMAPARHRLLDALASLAAIGIVPARRTQLALWAGVSPKSSGFANNLGALRTAGLIDYPAPSHVALTTTGRDLTGPVEVVVTDQALHQKVQALVSPARWRILTVLLQVHPQPVAKDALAEAAGVSPASSGFANNLGALRSLGLVDYPAPGQVAATDALFLEHVPT